MFCPSQWDAWTDTGEYLYLRFRHSTGVARREPSPDTDTWAWPISADNVVARFETEGEDDGVIGLDEFCQRAGLTLCERVDYKSFGEYLREGLDEALAEARAQKEENDG